MFVNSYLFPFLFFLYFFKILRTDTSFLLLTSLARNFDESHLPPLALPALSIVRHVGCDFGGK